MEKISRIIDSLSSGSMWLAVIGLFVLSAMVTVATLSRYFFNLPILGVDEISGYLNLLIGMLALAFTLRQKRHVRVDIVTQRLPIKVVKVLEVITTLLALVLLAQFMRTGWYTWMKLIGSDERAQTFLRTPLAWPYGFMLLGWTLFIMVILVHLVKSVRDLWQSAAENERDG
jgi:TRAP-type C4-dicarboxylate transport system permease small subunit